MSTHCVPRDRHCWGNMCSSKVRPRLRGASPFGAAAQLSPAVPLPEVVPAGHGAGTAAAHTGWYPGAGGASSLHSSIQRGTEVQVAAAQAGVLAALPAAADLGARSWESPGSMP